MESGAPLTATVLRQWMLGHGYVYEPRPSMGDHISHAGQPAVADLAADLHVSTRTLGRWLGGGTIPHWVGPMLARLK